MIVCLGHKTAVLASHGCLPDSGRKTSLLRPEPEPSMMMEGTRPPATPRVPTAPTDSHVPGRDLHGKTRRPVEHPGGQFQPAVSRTASIAAVNRRATLTP